MASRPRRCRRATRAAAWAATLALAAGTGGGCGSGSGDSPPSSPRETDRAQILELIDTAATAIDTNDPRTLCTTFAIRIRDTSTYSSKGCVGTYADQIPQIPANRKRKVLSIDFHGNQATVQARERPDHPISKAEDHPVHTTANFIRENGAWKIQAWFRNTPPDDQHQHPDGGNADHDHR